VFAMLVCLVCSRIGHKKTHVCSSALSSRGTYYRPGNYYRRVAVGQPPVSSLTDSKQS
jgi:hypothetical protein